MKTTTHAVSKFTPILVAALALALVPAAKAAQAPVLALGAGYQKPHGSGRVAALQERLHLVGEDPGPVDGRFGPLTAAAVLRYQRRDGLLADGVAGRATLAALGHALAGTGRGAGFGAPAGSARVRALQRALVLAGADPGRVDGRFGALTEAALIRFQERHGLAADGLADAATRRALARLRGRPRSGRSPSRAKPRPTATAKPGAPAEPRPTGQAQPAAPVEAKPRGQAEANPEAPATATPETTGRVKSGATGNARPQATGNARPQATGNAKPQATGNAKPAAPAKPKPEAPAKPKPEAPAGTRPAPQGKRPGDSTEVGTVILLLAVVLLAVAGILGIPEILSRPHSPTAPTPRRRFDPVEEPDDSEVGEVVDGSRRPPRPRQPAQRGSGRGGRAM